MADLLLAKIMFNSVVSTKDARFMTLGIGNFYLNTPLKRYEYVWLKLTNIPEEIIVQYNLCAMATPDGYVYIEISKGMYGLPQAGLLAQQLLEERLNQQGYMQDTMVPGLWKHTTRPISFTLCVDDFGVKYVEREHAEHLIAVLQTHYKLGRCGNGSCINARRLDSHYCPDIIFDETKSPEIPGTTFNPHQPRVRSSRHRQGRVAQLPTIVEQS
jgi:hypothetical protein